MRYFIENDVLRAEFNSFGAELKSVKNKAGFEFIWQAGEIWPKSAPILFPIIGTLKNHQYQWKGETYPMTHHGFARDSEFVVLHQSAHSICFLLSTFEEPSKENYPFTFHFLVTYTLDGNQLIQRFRVINKGEDAMPFSVGAHPAFNLLPDEKYHLAFQKKENAKSYTITNGLISNEMRDVIHNENIISIEKHTFDEDALVFENLQSDEITLSNESGSHQVKVSIHQMPFLGIWAKPNAPFVCIEPWCGIADFETSNGTIEDKKGIQILPSGEEFCAEFLMEFIQK